MSKNSLSVSPSPVAASRESAVVFISNVVLGPSREEVCGTLTRCRYKGGVCAVLVLLAMLLGVGARAAVSVVTEPAGFVTTSSAQIRASVLGWSTVWFEYGTTTNYGGETEPITVTGSISPKSVDSLLVGLAAETLHHYRVVANDAFGDGVVYGNDRTFTTRAAVETAPGHALSFNGVNGYVTTSLLVTNPQTFTLSLWFKAITSRGGKLIGFGNSSNANSTLHDRAIYLNTNGTVFAGVHDGTAIRIASGTSVLNNGLWHHVACTFSPTNGLRLYVDGALEATNLIPTNAFVYNGYWRMGWDSGWLPNPQPYLDARVDEVQVWNVARPAAEIAGSLTAPLSGNEPGLVEYWRFSEGSGTTTADGAAARGGNTATLVGDVTWQLPAPARPFPPFPILSPLPATDVLAYSVRLNGAVNPNGSATTARFEYGLTTNYTGFTPVTLLGSTNVALAMNSIIGGLAGATTYHFRLVATNAAGLNHSVDQTFTTGVIPPAVVTTGASDVTRTGATLHGTVNPQLGATLAWFEYGPETGINSTSATTAVSATNVAIAVSNGIAGLTPGTRYLYRVAGSNSAGTTLGTVLTFTSAPPPLAAQTLAASNVREYAATLNGTVNPGGLATTWYFQYGLTTNYGLQTIAAMLPAGVVNTPVARSETALLPGNTYHCRVVASNATGTVFGNDVTFNTPAAAPFPVTLDATGVTASNAVLQGVVNPGGGPASVEFQYGTNSRSYIFTSPLISLPAGNADVYTNFAVGGLDFSRTYFFRVVAWRGPQLWGEERSFTTLPLAPVAQTLAADNVSTGGARLNATVHPGGAVTRLWFEYGTTTNYGAFSGTNTIAALRTNVTTNLGLAGLLPGVTYHCRVHTVNSQGASSGTNITFTTPPALPSFLSSPVATSITATSALLQATVNPGGATARLYFRYGTNVIATQTSAGAIVMGDAGVTVTNVLVSGLLPGTVYLFQTWVTNVAGSNWTGFLNFTTLPDAPLAQTLTATNLGGSTATLRAQVNPRGGGTEVYFEYGLTTNYGTFSGTNVLAGGNAANAVNIAIAGLSHNTPYHCRVIASNSAGRVTGSNVTFATLPAPIATTLPPNPLTPTSATMRGLVTMYDLAVTARLEWGNTPAYGQAQGFAMPSGFGESEPISRPWSNLLPDTTYHYRCYAFNAYGTNYGSNVSFTTPKSAPLVQTLAASNVTSTSATLRGDVIHHGGRSPRYWYEYGEGASLGNASPARFLPANPTVLNFNGTNQHITTTQSFNLSNQSFTVEAWVRRADANRNDYFFQQGSNGVVNKTLTFGYRPNNRFTFAFWGNDLDTTNTYTDTNWHHWAGAYDAATGLRRLYLDGTLVATNTTPTNYQGSGVFTLGRSPGVGSWFSGDLSEVRVWLTARTGAEIVSNLTVSATGNEPGLLACWHLNEGTGSTARDATTNANHGTLVNAPGWHAPEPYDLPVSGLLPGVSHSFRFAAANPLGTNYGATLTFTTTPVPALATTLPATNITPTEATLYGTVNPNGPAGWYFQIDTTTNFTTTLQSQFLPPGTNGVTVTATLSNLAPGITYYHRLVATNGAGATHGAILSFTTPGVTAPQLGVPMRLPDGSLQFTFTSTPGLSFTVRATTNVALPTAQWINLGPALESPAGQFRFTDESATNHPQRFYHVTVP